MSIRLPGDNVNGDNNLCECGIPGPGEEFGTIIVNFKPGTTAEQIEAVLACFRSHPSITAAEQRGQNHPNNKLKGCIDWTYPIIPSDLVAELEKLPEVESAEELLPLHMEKSKLPENLCGTTVPGADPLANIPVKSAHGDKQPGWNLNKCGVALVAPGSNENVNWCGTGVHGGDNLADKPTPAERKPGGWCGTVPPGAKDPLAGLIAVTFTDDTSEERAAAILDSYRTRSEVKYVLSLLGMNLPKKRGSIDLHDPADLDAILEELAALPEVEEAENIKRHYKKQS